MANPVLVGSEITSPGTGTHEMLSVSGRHVFVYYDRYRLENSAPASDARRRADQ